MVLNGNLYSIMGMNSSPDGALSYDVRLEPSSEIYRAHFPGNPITPGVCTLQMASELLSLHLGRPLGISVVRSVKFISLIRPDSTPCVRFAFSGVRQDGGRVEARVTVTAGDNILSRIHFICQDNDA